jgi:hypothetical protein
MRGNFDFITNGYGEQLGQKIFDAYCSRAYLNSYDIQVLKKVGNKVTNIHSLINNTITFRGQTVTISFKTELIQDDSLANGQIRFEGKHPDYTILFIDSKLPSNRLEKIALLTEDGQYLAI